MSLAEHAALRPWLSLVGLGANGAASLSEDAREAITRAELVVGSRRQLGLVRALIAGEARAWPSPITEGIAHVLARRGRPTCVLASGDPFWYGIGATLARTLPRHEFACFPAPSSLSLAAARLGWPLQDVDVVSLHGRALEGLLRHLAPRRRLLVLSWNRETPRAAAHLLVERGYGASQMWVLEALGGPQESVREVGAKELAAMSDASFDDLNLLAIELVAAPSALPRATRGCLPDDAFEHDGQLTKRDVRAITLSSLAPFPGALLWDVGAGSGSIAIEWLRSHPANRAIAIERDAIRAERIRWNARALGVPSLEVLHGSAPSALVGLPAPDAVFIGGSAADLTLFARCWDALGTGGRLVINAVTLEGEASLLGLYANHGGELCRISLEHAAKLGKLTAYRPAMTVVQWRISKP